MEDKIGRFGLFVILALLSTSGVHAQVAEFADDFSTNTIRYVVETNNVDGDNTNVNLDSGVIQLSSTNDGIDSEQAMIRVYENTNTFEISGRFDEDTIMLEDGWAQISVGGAVSNNIPIIDRVASNPEIGDISVSVNSSIFTDNSTNLFICFGRSGVDGYEDYKIFENSTTHCKNYDSNSPAPGEEIILGISAGTDNVILVTLSDTTDSIVLPGEYHAPGKKDHYIEQVVGGGVGSAKFHLSSITTDAGIDDFMLEAPVLDRYRFNTPGWQGFPTIVNERLRADFVSREEGGNSVELNVNDVGTYFESTVELSSESTFDNVNQSVSAYVEAVMGNDTQDNGFDGSIGDIRATIAIEARYDGLRRIEYCLDRFEDADGNDRQGLLNEGNNRCLQFPILTEFDKAYRVALDFDKETSSVTLRINGYSHTETLAGLFTANSPRASVGIGGGYGSRFVGFIDDIRNSKTALTAIESVSPASFPPEASTESTVLDSTIDAPYDFKQTPLSFVDDFSSDTSVIGSNQWDDSESSITYTDGAVELQVSSKRDPDDGGGATLFDMRGVADTIVVRGALSSDSRTGPGDGNEVSFDIEAVFFNDSVDGGSEGRVGDIEAKIRLKMEGNGRRQVQAEYRRTGVDGNRERLEVFPDGNDRYNFNGLIPQLDTIYTLTLKLDRANNQLIYSIDDEMIAVPITGGIFAAASNYAQVRAYHQGTSGRAEVRIFSIDVDDQLFDFEQSAPVIAPYRPRYSDEVAGVDTTVVDGRLRLVADGRIDSGRDSQMRINGRSSFVGADIELSSESLVAEGESIFVGVGGSIYSDIDNGDDNSEGKVFAAVRLYMESDGSRFVERCAWRSNDENFDDSSELIGGVSDRCTRFDITPELDTIYSASISLDEEAKTLTFKFGEESLVYSILTEIYTVQEGFNGVRARTDDNSKVVAYADNLAFAEDPVPLAESDQNFGNVIGESKFDDSPDSETTGVEMSDGSSGGGGGCSISGSGNPVLILLAMFAFIRILRSKYRY